MKYYEILFKDNYGICIRGIRKPSKAEAADFLREDMERFGYTEKDIYSITELTKTDAFAFYDMEDSDGFPVFSA